MSTIPQSPSTDFTSTTLNGTINDSTQTITVNDASTIITPTYGVIDREDNNGTATPNQREVIYISAKSGNDLTVTRGVDNSTARSHNDSAKVEPMITVGFWDDFYDAYDLDHNPADGSHDITKVAMLSGATVQTLESKILSNPTIIGGSGFPLTPVWVLAGIGSGATTSVGKPLDMPSSATIQWASVVLRSAISGASLLIDINKNFTSIFEAGTRLTILGGGTFASTASINTKNFVAGSIFSVDIDNGGWFNDAVVKFKAQ
jgi:hypothetical protein